MRKTYRQFATVFALLMLALFLVGCDALDAMREEHGVYAGETDRSTVTFRGETYRELGLDAEKLFYRDLSSRVYITEPDVPVLLASTVGEYGQTDAELNFIVLYRERNAVYAREDVYEEALAETKMEDPYTCIRLQYLDGKNSGRGWQYHTLSEAEEALVRRVLAGVPLKEEAVDFAYLSPSQTLFFESETGLFADNSYEIVEFSGGVAIRDFNFYDKGDPEYYIAGEADALLLKELLDKYPG